MVLSTRTAVGALLTRAVEAYSTSMSALSETTMLGSAVPVTLMKTRWSVPCPPGPVSMARGKWNTAMPIESVVAMPSMFMPLSASSAFGYSSSSTPAIGRPCVSASAYPSTAPATIVCMTIRKGKLTIAASAAATLTTCPVSSPEKRKPKPVIAAAQFVGHVDEYPVRTGHPGPRRRTSRPPWRSRTARR